MVREPRFYAVQEACGLLRATPGIEPVHANEALMSAAAILSFRPEHDAEVRLIGGSMTSDSRATSATSARSGDWNEGLPQAD